MSDANKYITLDNLKYFLEKFKEMMAGTNKEETQEGSKDSSLKEETEK